MKDGPELGGRAPRRPRKGQEDVPPAGAPQTPREDSGGRSRSPLGLLTPKQSSQRPPNTHKA